MSELKKWRVTGPDGFEIVESFHDGHNEASVLKWLLDLKLMRHCGVQVMRQAGYRAEPIEEPKMVTVRAEDVQEAIDMIGAGLMWASHHPTSPYLSTAEYNKDSAYGRARNVRSRLRAALDGAK